MENSVLWIFLTATCVIKGVCSQSVQMEAGQSGFVGSKVDLPCLFINSIPPVKISQVTWQKVINGKKQNVAIANPSLGVSVAPPFKDRVSFKNPVVRRRTPSLEDTTLTFSSLRLSDEATYICEYTTFPAGNRENTVNLTVYARPLTQMSLSTPTLVARSSNLKTPVATCLSANGKPPGTIRWDTRVRGEATTQEIRNSDGTITVRSDFILVPSKNTHLEKLTCITSYNQETYTDSVTLDIQYEPEVSVEGFDGNWYLDRQNVELTCLTDANPPVSLFQWRMLNGSIPNSVEIRDNVLLFKGPIRYEVGGIYVCDATNSIGTSSAFMEISITEEPLPQVGTGDVFSVLGMLLAVGLILGVAITVLLLNRRKPRGEMDADSTDSAPSLKLAPPPARRKPGDEFQRSGRVYEDLPNTADYVSYRLACNKDDYPEPYSPPINPPLSLPDSPPINPPLLPLPARLHPLQQYLLPRLPSLLCLQISFPPLPIPPSRPCTLHLP
ncbi:nectin-1-like isoform X2 [Oncorhynchus tshawytscha]|uniref:Ig-like domain-containing protein n=1 Tax=Oncorhynchus tshawytscha TaxID=74940 RepID=A0AAZ3P8V8_ONCTS|nr:nectin-1-like isoform X2 [Oncorhynchus tshawytscha]